MRGLGGELSAKVPVEGRGRATLLHVAQDVVSHREGSLAFLAVDPGQVLRRVLKVGLLVVQDDASLDLALKCRFFSSQSSSSWLATSGRTTRQLKNQF